MQLRQAQGGFLVRLDLHTGDQTHVGRMDRNYGTNQWKQSVIEQVCIGGHLHHDGIRRLEMLAPPLFQLFIHDFVRTEDRLFFSVHPYSHKIRLVDIQPDPTTNIRQTLA